jgi:hypothetical protein
MILYGHHEVSNVYTETLVQAIVVYLQKVLIKFISIDIQLVYFLSICLDSGIENTQLVGYQITNHGRS